MAGFSRCFRHPTSYTPKPEIDSNSAEWILRGLSPSRFALIPIPYTLHPAPYTLHPTRYTLPYTLHTTPHTLNPTHYTLYTTPYTLHPKPYTLHTSHHTLHPTPYTLQPLSLTPVDCGRYHGHPEINSIRAWIPNPNTGSWLGMKLPKVPETRNPKPPRGHAPGPKP